jgi:hypothetical protein
MNIARPRPTWARLAQFITADEARAAAPVSAHPQFRTHRPCAPDLHQLCQPLGLSPQFPHSLAHLLHLGSAQTVRCRVSHVFRRPPVASPSPGSGRRGRSVSAHRAVKALATPLSIAPPTARTSIDHRKEVGRTAPVRVDYGQRSAWVTAARAWDAEWTVCSSPKPSEMAA